MSIYTTSTLGAGSHILTFNDATKTPYYRVTREDPRSFQVRNYDSPLPQESGMLDFRTLIGRSDLVLTGTMYPGNESEYDSGRKLLRKICSADFWQDNDDSDEGYIPYKYNEGVRDYQIFVKPLYVYAPKTSASGFKQPFSIFCKIKYPVVFGAATKVFGNFGVPGVIIGAAKYPLKYPIAFGSQQYSVTALANNEGDIPTYPASITVTGPINRPRIANQTTGEYIEIDVNLPTQSDILSIVYDQDSISITANGLSVYNKLLEGSTLFKIRDGSNDIVLTGLSVSAGATLTGTFMDAYPLA